MSDPDIRLERASSAPVERLWEVLVHPALWWGEDVVLEPRPGGAFHEPWRDALGQQHTRGSVLDIAPPHRLCLSWRDDDWTFETAVRFALRAEGGGSRVDLCHSGWQAAPDAHRAKLLNAHRDGWTYHLANLASCAEHAGRGPATEGMDR